MITGEQIADPVFSPDEQLYQRCKKVHLDPGGRPTPAALPSPAYSVNRGKFGPAEDVLLPAELYAEYGIFSYRVGDLPAPVAEAGLQYSFSVLHLPEPLNYHHSEVHTMCAGADMTKPAPKQVKKYFRTLIARASKLLKQPQI